MTRSNSEGDIHVGKPPNIYGYGISISRKYPRGPTIETGISHLQSQATIMAHNPQLSELLTVGFSSLFIRGNISFLWLYIILSKTLQAKLPVEYRYITCWQSSKVAFITCQLVPHTHTSCSKE